MELFIKSVTNWPKLVIALVVLLTMGIASQMAKMQIETDTEAFIPPGHQATLDNTRMKEIFGTPDLLWIGVVREDGGIYQSDTLKVIQSISDKVRLLPGVVDQDVVSIATEDNIRGTADGMEVEPFMQEVPDDAAALLSLQQQIQGFDIFDGFIVAKNGAAAAILVELEPHTLLADRGLDKFKLYDAVQSIVDEVAQGRPEQFHVAGKPVLEATLGLYITEDLSVMMPLVFLVLSILLYFTYRSARGVFIPLAVVSFSVMGAMGIMAAVGVPMYPTTTMVPVTLMAIGVADAIHLLGKYYELVLLNPAIDRKSVVRDTMTEMWRPVVLTSITTAVGFLSFLTMEMVPLQMMGVFAAVGIIYAMFVSLTLVPALLVLMKVSAPKSLVEKVSQGHGLEGAGLVSRYLTLLGDWVGRHVTGTLFLTSALIFLSAWGASRVYVDDSYVSNFEQDSAIVEADRVVNKHFIGSYQFNVVLEAKDAEAFYSPELLQAVWSFQQEMEAKNTIVGGSISIVDYIRRMHQVMNENRPEMAKIPESSDLIAQYLLLYSFSGAPDDFAEVIDSEYRIANVRLFMTNGIYSKYHKIEADLHALAAQYFDPLGVQWSITGNGHISYVQTGMITNNLRFNIIATVLAIFLAAWIMMRSFVAGIFVMTPVLAAVILNFAFMGLTGTTIGWGSSMFTSIAICIGVDYAIHLIYKYRNEYNSLRDDKRALTRTLATTGKTILFNAVVVVAGFMVLIASVMPPNQEMGLLVSAAMFSSFVATLTVLPALILAAKPKFVFAGNKFETSKEQ
ncbi:efflux RND transporter permease subunit [Mariprofundus micogutta]|nr:MMPL family transporter [Mariprofundus micogutta]